ncbi:hypothetical protein KNP414_04968 [Paenibacillus mucilaginosus KNP414]|uniref:Uncharacterized protein n=1 Tax=Paenibacillus mucilaginosus (strain KNP414) TaxID=1036673 RepID=F8FLC5_PAEMK|nr:hypothetical protein KNP414_04968 [Paenibacillus mucilaginosus KNP414]
MTPLKLKPHYLSNHIVDFYTGARPVSRVYFQALHEVPNDYGSRAAS